MHQGHFGEYLIKMMAAAAGYTVLVENPDANGIDLLVRSKGHASLPLVQFQVKTWSNPKGDATHLSYRGLTASQFNNIAGPGFRNPCYLVVLVVPSDPALYLTAHDDHLETLCVPYWASLADREQIDQPKEKPAPKISIPRANRLDVVSLVRLVDESMVGEVR